MYYPRQKYLFGTVPWICPTGIYLPHCAGVHLGPIKFDSFEDTSPAFGKAADQCSDPLAIPAAVEIPVFSCREVDEVPTILGMRYWMHNPKPLISFTGGCSEIQVQGLLVWVFKVVLGYECGLCPI